jgi:hypothetical protein
MISTLESASIQEVCHLLAVVGLVVVAVIYAVNSLGQQRKRAIDQTLHYLEWHGKLFEAEGYCLTNMAAMENGEYKRDPENEEMELKFAEFLTVCEQIAMLQNAGGAPKRINAYMMGWFAKQIVPQLTTRETEEPYWELAVAFLRETAREAEKLDAMPKAKRVRYLRKNHFAYGML